MNLIINLDHDDWILTDPEATLQSVGCGESGLHPSPQLGDLGVLADLAENETELSLFNRKDYEEFKKDPETRWD